MPEEQYEEPGRAQGELLKSSDFSEQLRSRDQEDVRQVLNIPDIDSVLKELQRKHGIRIGLSPALIRRFQQGKAEAEAVAAGLPAVADEFCQVQDICILCDHGDACQTCDMMDWCVWNDTHVLAE